MKSKDFLFALAMIGCLLSLLIGLYVGYKVAVGYYEPEIKRLNNELDHAQDKAQEQVKFWQDTLRGLAGGGQLQGVSLNGKPNTKD